MAEDQLIKARRRAERAVEGMAEGPLKTAAFQTILTKLLNDSPLVEQASHPPDKDRVNSKVQPDTLKGRVLAVKAEGFFKIQRSLSEVREALGSRGWHYPLTTLSGGMQSIVQQRQLRRERISVRGKQVWKYSNF